MIEPNVPFGTTFGSMFNNRVDCSDLLLHGWRHHQKWPYDDPKWGDIMDIYDKDGNRVISCNAYSGVRIKGQSIRYFKSLEQLKAILAYDLH